jgi:hypothetical protein
MGDGDVVGNDFDGFAAAEGVDIWDGWDEVKTEVFVLPRFDQVAFIVWRRVVKVFQSPMAGIDAASKKSLHGGDVESRIHQVSTNC